MIAAVVDRRGGVAAEETLARMGRFSEVHRAGGVTVGRAEGAADAARVAASVRVADAASIEGTSALAAPSADRDGDLVLARGSLGGRPMYFARSSTGWVACSRVEGLLRALDRSPAANADRVASMTAGMQHADARATPLEGVMRTGPCEAIVLRADATTFDARARAPKRRSPLDGASVEDLARELWKRVVASVERAIGGRRTVGVMVGGGLDSSGLLAAAVAHARGAAGREVVALALDFDAIGGDRRYLDDLARDLGIVPLRLRPAEAAPMWRSSFVMDAQPYILTIGPMEQLVFGRARDRGAEVLLSGYLADEILAGDLRALAAEAISGSPIRAIRSAIAVRLPWETTARERLSNYVLRPIFKPLVPRRWLARASAGQHERDYPWRGPRMTQVLADLRTWGADQPPPRTPEERFDRFARSGLLADYGDMRGQIEAKTGLVREDPYADEAVLDLVSRVPPHVLVHNDLHRGLFREALRGQVPESIRMRTDKSCFEPAFAEVAEAAGGLASLGDLWDMRELESLGVLDRAKFRAAMEPLFRDPASTAACAEAWSYATQALACESFARGRKARVEQAA